MPLTANDVAQLQTRIDAGDRAGFYIQYYNMTGSAEALTQAQVSSYSGQIGQLALYANSAARVYLSLRDRSDQYPGTTDNFSLLIATDLLTKIKNSVVSGGTGVFSDKEIFDFAQRQWALHDIGDCFPGNLISPGLPQTALDQNYCSIFADFAAVHALGNIPLVEVGRSTVPALPGNSIFPPPIPPGGQQITTPDGLVRYIIDSAGNTVYGSVEQLGGPPPQFNYSLTSSGNQIQIDGTFAGPNGPLHLTETLATTIVNGAAVVTGETATLTTPLQTVQFNASATGGGTISIGPTSIAFASGEFIGATVANGALNLDFSPTSGGLARFFTDLPNGSLTLNVGGNSVAVVATSEITVDATGTIKIADHDLQHITSFPVDGTRIDTIFNPDGSKVDKSFDQSDQFDWDHRSVDTGVGGQPLYTVEVADGGAISSFLWHGQPFGAGDIAATFGSSLGKLLGGNSLVGQLAAGTLIGEIGRQIGAALQYSTTFTIDGAVNNAFGVLAGAPGIGTLPSAGIGALSSLLVGELANSLHLSGFEHGLFQSVGTTITTQLVTNAYGIVTGAVHTDPLNTPWALTDGFDPASLATSISGAVGAYFGSYLAGQVVHAHYETGSIGGSIGSSIGAMLGMATPLGLPRSARRVRKNGAARCKNAAPAAASPAGRAFSTGNTLRLPEPRLAA